MTPLYAAAGFVALVLKAPHKAASLRSKFMRSPSSYEAVFNESAPLEVWPKIVHLLKRVDTGLELLRPRSKVTDKFLKGWRYITALLLVSEHFGKYAYSARELATFDVSLVTTQAVESIWADLNRMSTTTRMGGWTSLSNVLRACDQFAKERGISDIKSLSTIQPLSGLSEGQQARRTPITDEFIEQVRNALPAQPWKPGLHRKISAQLKCETSDYFAAVERLIEDGTFLKQRDGVLYDPEGNVVLFDPERVDPETLELRESKA